MTITQDLEQKGLSVVEQAYPLLITNTTSYEAATSLLLSVKELLKEVANTFNPIIDKQYAAHREALAQKKRHEDPLLRAEAILKPRIAQYLHEQEQQRLAIERKAKEDAQLQEAVDAEARGDQAGADAAINGQGIVNVSVPSSTPKVAGISTRELWSVEVTDKVALIKAVAAGLAPVNILDVNQTVANQMARALKTSLKYPGLKAVCTKTVAAGSRL